MQYYKKLSLSDLNLFLLPLLRMLAVFPQSNLLVVFHDDYDDEDRFEILVLHDECRVVVCIV